MNAQVVIKNGSYRNAPVTGRFTLLKAWKAGAKGGFVTVQNNGTLEGAAPTAAVRVTCAFEDLEFIGDVETGYTSPGAQQEEHAAVQETDEETMARIEKTFAYIETLAAAAQRNDITGLIISGPAGVGKSFGVEKTLERMNMTRKLAGHPEKYDIITGGTSAIGLYIKLWDNRHEGNVLVFDDCDTALWDELQLNLLKAAMDTKKARKICWMKESNALKGNGDDEGGDIPDTFEFKGSIIFLTNLKFDQCGSKKISEHLKAIMSRVHYLDLCLDTRREQLLRVKQVVASGMLDNHNLDDTTKDAVVNYVYDNVDYLHELSLRTVLKVADLAKICKKTWMDTADFTVLSHRGRMAKLAKANKAAN